MINSNRNRRAVLRKRRHENQRRSLGTILLRSGVPETVAPAVSRALASAAKRIGVQPVARKRTTRQIGVQGRVPSRPVHHWTRAQLRTVIPAYRPRKPEYVAAIATLKAAIGQ